MRRLADREHLVRVGPDRILDHRRAQLRLQTFEVVVRVGEKVLVRDLLAPQRRVRAPPVAVRLTAREALAQAG